MIRDLADSGDPTLAPLRRELATGWDQMAQVLNQIDRTTRRLNETLQTIEPNPSTVFWGGLASPKEPQ